MMSTFEKGECMCVCVWVREGMVGISQLFKRKSLVSVSLTVMTRKPKLIALFNSFNILCIMSINRNWELGN